jgi:hypothetical protein
MCWSLPLYYGMEKQGQEGKEIQFEKKVGNDLLWID